MKKIFDYIVSGICIIIVMFCMITCTHYLTISNLDDAGYTYIKYEAGSYKVYDKETKVIYLYSSETSEYHPVYNNDGSLMIYDK